MTAEQNLARLGLALPSAPAPAANYAPFVLTGSLLVVSGQLPLLNGALSAWHHGKLGASIAPETGKEAAQLAALNALAQAKAALGSLDRVRRVVRLGGFVNAAPGFTALPAVMNGASDLMVAVFGEKGRHARTTIGVAELPLDACIEVEALFEIEP